VSRSAQFDAFSTKSKRIASGPRRAAIKRAKRRPKPGQTAEQLAALKALYGAP